MILTQKETMLLQDLKTQEQLCIEKYQRYAEKAGDQELKTLFTTIGQTEQQHLNTVNQMLQGTVPMMNAGGGQQPQQQQQTQIPKIGHNCKEGGCAGAEKQNDAYLCQDALGTEKHVSAEYDSFIFEFKDAGMRNALNHIQKEEQEHGKKIYDYMAQHNMYN